MKPTPAQPSALGLSFLKTFFIWSLDPVIFNSYFSSSFIFFFELVVLVREQDSNLRPSGYEPDELILFSIPHIMLCLLLERGWDSNPRPSGYEPDVLPLHNPARLGVRRDSNPRVQEPQSCALPTELLTPCVNIFTYGYLLCSGFCSIFYNVFSLVYVIFYYTSVLFI